MPISLPFRQTVTARRRILAAGSLILLSASAAFIPHMASAEPVCPDKPIVIASNASEVFGTECADMVFAGPNVMTLNTFGGDDIVNVSASAKEGGVFDLGDGNDRLVSFRNHGATCHGGLGDDTIQTKTSASQIARQELNGGDGNDTLLVGGAGGADGGAGNDLITFSAGGKYPGDLSNNILAIGGMGNDTVDIRNQADNGGGERTVNLGPGNDRVLSAQKPTAVSDFIDGGTGFDTANIGLLDGSDHVEMTILTK